MTTENVTINPLLASLKLPGRTFTLPSRGALYNAGEVDAADGDIHVQAMSALDEITLKNSDLLFNGTALDDVVKSCVPSIKKPQDLYGKDIDALLIYLRLVAYGPEFSVKVKHDCEDAKEHDYIINIEKLILDMPYLDPTEIEDKYTTVLDNGQKVKVRPIRYRDIISLFQDSFKRKNSNTPLTTEDVKENLLKSIILVIDSVDGITDPKMIEEWARMLTTKQHNRIAEAIERTNEWGPKNSSEIVCADCGKKFEIELPLNPISFFTE